MFLKIFTYWEHYFGCSKFWRCRFHDLFILYVWILFDANLLSILGLNMIILLSYYQPLPVFLFCQQQPIQLKQMLLRNTTVGGLRTPENVGRIEKFFEYSFTDNNLPNSTEVLWAEDAKPLDWGSPLFSRVRIIECMWFFSCSNLIGYFTLII